ncbi:uncharacterized protein LOC113857017 [Abrus precatorius]|uniref:Uncharacterized protein LOC113857017 n=1 Tax=Abrus precatorius TaxID=3816 RepID=A0A8B8KL38_ABRPR|nr:uncharacterized protein LOC113857017 [Abrus precatorius]
MPNFEEGNFSDVSGDVVANSTDEEINSADEAKTVLSTRQFPSYGPQCIRNEQVSDTRRNSEALLRSKGSASYSASHSTCSKTNTSGIRSTSKPRFSLPSVSHKCEHIDPSVTNIESLPESMKAVDPIDSKNLDGNYLDNDDGGMEIMSDTESAETEPLAAGFNLPSVADLFDNLLDKTDLRLPHDCEGRGKKVQLFQKSGRSHLQDTVADSEDSPEPVDSGSSSDNEVNDQHIITAFPRKKMQTMVERFDEALGTSAVIAEGIHVGALNSLRAGFFGKLEQVMQKEKERDVYFWTNLQAGARPDSELGCIDVKIISRSMNGKLTVCHCSFAKSTENVVLQDYSEGMGIGDSESGKKTIIFSSRVCNTANLEVGNLIRVHPPWKEVQVGNDNIILCTYFSEILSPV